MNKLSKEKIDLLSQETANFKIKAYAPYSKFNVSALFYIKNDTSEWIIQGVNIENSSFPVTLCAERTAFAQIIIQKISFENIKALFLSTDSANYGAPCGMCRQFLSEFLPSDFPIYLIKTNSKTKNKVEGFQITTMGDLLPQSFSKRDL